MHNFLPTVILLKLDVGPEPVGTVITYSNMVETSYMTRYSLIVSQTMQKTITKGQNVTVALEVPGQEINGEVCNNLTSL